MQYALHQGIATFQNFIAERQSPTTPIIDATTTASLMQHRKDLEDEIESIQK